MSEGKNRRPSKVRAKGRLFHLVHPIACVIEKREGLFLSEDANLDIIAYGETREEVIREFSNEFAVLWDAIAQEDDILLTQDALVLKRKLIDLVSEVEVYGAKEDAGD